MAGIGLNVQARFDELLKLKKEIEETKNALKSMDQAADPKGFKEQEKHLKSLQKEHEKVYKSIHSVTYEFQKMERAGKETFANLSEASKVKELSEQLGIQKRVLFDLGRQ